MTVVALQEIDKKNTVVFLTGYSCATCGRTLAMCLIIVSNIFVDFHIWDFDRYIFLSDRCCATGQIASWCMFDQHGVAEHFIITVKIY